MAAGTKRNKKKRDHAGRPPRVTKAYARNLLEAKFIPGREYTMKFICEQLNEKVPTNNQMRTRIWDQMGLAGAVWERVRGSKYYLYKGLKDKPRDYDKYSAIVCAKKRIIDAFGMDEQECTITNFLGYEDLCRIYYMKGIREILLPQQGYDKDSMEYKVIGTLNRIIRINMYTIFWEDMKGWKRNIGHPEYNVLIPERRNQIVKRFRYNDATLGMIISDSTMTENIEEKCKGGFAKGKRLLYGKRKNPYDFMKAQGIEVIGTVYRIQLIKDVPSKYHCNARKVQETLEKRLQKTVYKYIKSDRYKKEILIEDEYSREDFDKKIDEYFMAWSQSMTYPLNEEDYKVLDTKGTGVQHTMTILEGDLMIGEGGDIEEDDDFISYAYEYELG